ncbi:MAG: DUF2934 domain-containing protein [Deltaproteobacteria bacterium]|nr:DUF2934 domain-containing protein [Deltaproteobacteria bacterium]
MENQNGSTIAEQGLKNGKLGTKITAVVIAQGQTLYVSPINERIGRPTRMGLCLLNGAATHTQPNQPQVSQPQISQQQVSQQQINQPQTNEAKSCHATPQQIALRAWEIWQAEGCPQGREIEHWLRAEAELG